MVARFRETIPTVKYVSSSEIYKNFGFLPKLQFCLFSENWNFLESYNYNEEFTSRDDEKLEKIKNLENDAQTSKELVVKEEEESYFPESHEKIKDEVVKTILEMTLWGEMHEEWKNEKMTPISDLDEYIIQLNNEVKGKL